MAMSAFQRRTARTSRGAAAAGVLGIAGASLFAATPAFAADYECDVYDGLPAPTLVADGVCQIVITHADTPDNSTTFIFPAAMGKIQAVVVGAGGGGATVAPVYDNYDYGAYGGGGGQVAFVDEVALDTEIAIYVGGGGQAAYGEDAEDGEASLFDYDPADPIIAIGGYGATEFGGGDTDPMYDNATDTWVPGTSGDLEYFLLDFDAESYYLGGGAGASGDADGEIPGTGFVLSDLVSEFGADADLFPAAADDMVYGQGGTGFIEWSDIALSSGFDSLAAAAETAPASSGQGGDANFYAYDPSTEPSDAYFVGDDAADGADGAVILRYGAAELAATGADTGAALAAGAAAAAAGAALVGIAARRRHATR